jgi:hypothetical protein
MPRVEFEPTTLMLELAKTVHASDRTASDGASIFSTKHVTLKQYLSRKVLGLTSVMTHMFLQNTGTHLAQDNTASHIRTQLYDSSYSYSLHLLFEMRKMQSHFMKWMRSLRRARGSIVG